MDDKWGKGTELISPILLRRRLSAPEIIMRKHMLTQQRSHSQDSDSTQSGRRILYWKNDMESGSDLNLNGAREPDLMRKSTLLRRMWNHNKPTSRSFANGKLYSGRSSHSLTSIHSSPERICKKEFPTSPQHRRLSPKHQRSKTSESSTTFTPKTITDTIYTSYTTCSDDSAYIQSRSNYAESSNNNSSASFEIRKNIIEDTEVSNDDSNTKVPTTYLKSSNGGNETATQTVTTPNVNVISNVQLSQSTLDLIYSQVMQDVEKKDMSNNNNDDPKIVQVRQIPSFYLKPQEHVENKTLNNQIVKYLISNVGAGSSYHKPLDASKVVVPRFSARPQTTSMEVNLSSDEFGDKDSDTASLVDSLEDTSSFHTDILPNETTIKSDESLELPDNSTMEHSPRKPTAFYIPIELEERAELKAVSEHLPDKVKNKLIKRQQKRTERIQIRREHNSSRSDSNYISASDNGNHLYYTVDSSGDATISNDGHYTKSKKRGNKVLLPSIETCRRIRIGKNRNEDQNTKPMKRKTLKENLPDGIYNRTKQTYWLPKTKIEKLSPLYTAKNEYIYDFGPRRIYHKTEFNNTTRKIEILEIVECMDASEKHPAKTKSKIPVLINHKLPKINKRSKLETPPSSLGFSKVVNDPKLDQLIANILIETLNMPSKNTSPVQESPKLRQKFEVIPEELSFQSSTEINDQVNNNEKKNDEKTYKGKAAVAVVKEDNLSSIPKGWITFYMMHNNLGSPDITSDEGKTEIKEQIKSADENFNYDLIKKGVCESNYSSSSDIPAKLISNRQKKYTIRKIKSKPDTEKHKIGEWSVTVSGTNNNGQLPPNFEMSLKFPEVVQNYNPSQSDSGLGEDIENKFQILPNEHKEPKSNESKSGVLPRIDNKVVAKKYRRSDSSIPSLAGLSSRADPRPTRTSIRRYNLNKPKLKYQEFDSNKNTQVSGDSNSLP